MKRPAITFISILVISIILFVLGLYLFSDLYDYFLPDVEGGFYQITNHSSPFKVSLIFSFAFGLIPVLTFLVWKIAKINSVNKKLLSVLIILSCMIGSVLLKREMIKRYFSQLNMDNKKLTVTYPFDEVHFEYYLLAGLLAGCFISYLLFRQKS